MSKGRKNYYMKILTVSLIEPEGNSNKDFKRVWFACLFQARREVFRVYGTYTHIGDNNWT